MVIQDKHLVGAFEEKERKFATYVKPRSGRDIEESFVSSGNLMTALEEFVRHGKGTGSSDFFRGALISITAPPDLGGHQVFIRSFVPHDVNEIEWYNPIGGRGNVEFKRVMP